MTLPRRRPHSCRGVWIVAFFSPVVAKGQARIRTQLSAVRTRENLERALAAFVKVGKKHDVLWKTKAKRLARCGL